MASSSERFRNPSFHKVSYAKLNEFRLRRRLCDFNVPVSWLFGFFRENNTLKVDGKVIPAHAVLLTNRIPFFKRVVEGETSALEALKRISFE